MFKKTILAVVCLVALGASSLLATSLADYEYAYTLDSGTRSISVSSDGSNVGFTHQVGTQKIDMTQCTQVAVTGTITNWNGYAGVNDWSGLWTSLGMIGTDYWTGRDTSSTFAYLGNSEYGDAAHQCGLGASGMVPYQWNGSFYMVLEDKPGTKGTDVTIGTASPTLYFAVVFDIDALTMKGYASLDNSTWGTSTISLVGGAAYNDWSECVFSACAANNSSWVSTMGYDVDFKVTSTVPEPVSMSLLLIGVAGLVRRYRR